MNALFRRELAVSAALIVLLVLPQIATANQHCGPGFREVSEGSGLYHCEAVAWICRSQDSKGHWGRGWNNDKEAAKQRALYECNRRAGGGCSILSCNGQQTAQLQTVQPRGLVIVPRNHVDPELKNAGPPLTPYQAYLAGFDDRTQTEKLKDLALTWAHRWLEGWRRMNNPAQDPGELVEVEYFHGQPQILLLPVNPANTVADRG
jgi:hypothetical protein